MASEWTSRSDSSRFEQLQHDGKKIDRSGQYMNSSITQVGLGYAFTLRVGLQVILRSLIGSAVGPRRIVVARGRVTGIGDLSRAGIVRLWSWVGKEFLVLTTLLVLPHPWRIHVAVLDGRYCECRWRWCASETCGWSCTSRACVCTWLCRTPGDTGSSCACQ